MSSIEVNAAALGSALINELAAAMGALVGARGTASLSAAGSEPAWLVTIAVGDPAPGAVTVGLAEADCALLVRASLGEQAEPADTAIVEMLQRVVAQAVGALRESPLGKGLLFCVETPARLITVPEEPPQFYAIALEQLAPVVAVWTAFESETGTSSATTGANSGGTGPTPVVKPPRGAPGPEVPSNLDVILDIDLPLSVRFGQTDLSLETLTRLGPGSVIDLGRSPDDPVEVLVNGRLVARGEVVVVGGNYGVRILEVVSAADRVRSLRG
jgi:flagellar motor switch protein FliN